MLLLLRHTPDEHSVILYAYGVGGWGGEGKIPTWTIAKPGFHVEDRTTGQSFQTFCSL